MKAIIFYRWFYEDSGEQYAEFSELSCAWRFQDDLEDRGALTNLIEYL